MKKLLFVFILMLSFIPSKAQYGSLNAILDLLEERQGINQHIENINIDNRKFILVKDFDDHTERNFIVIKGEKVTYVELFDDKKTGKSTSNVFTGDIIRSKKNIVSLRADFLEGKKIPIAITKTLLMTSQKKILYLIDINTKERWIDEAAFPKKK